MEPAHFFCAQLNSTPVRLYYQMHFFKHVSMNFNQNLTLPQYDPKNETHKQIARLSKQCHEKVAAGIIVSDVEEQVDELAAELWGLSKVELKDIKDSLPAATGLEEMK